MQKRIQLQSDLFELMVSYIEDHYDADDSDRYYCIVNAIKRKQEALARHNIYTIYKAGQNSEIREKARQIYLDKAGVLTDFRW